MPEVAPTGTATVSVAMVTLVGGTTIVVVPIIPGTVKVTTLFALIPEPTIVAIPSLTVRERMETAPQSTPLVEQLIPLFSVMLAPTLARLLGILLAKIPPTMVIGKVMPPMVSVVASN